jgi:hypothetical protein
VPDRREGCFPGRQGRSRAVTSVLARATRILICTFQKKKQKTKTKKQKTKQNKK